MPGLIVVSDCDAALDDFNGPAATGRAALGGVHELTERAERGPACAR